MIYCFVTPSILMACPFMYLYRVPVEINDMIINRILLPLRDDQKLDFLWRIGKAYTDSVKNPSAIVLYGRTGHDRQDRPLDQHYRDVQTTLSSG